MTGIAENSEVTADTPARDPWRTKTLSWEAGMPPTGFYADCRTIATSTDTTQELFVKQYTGRGSGVWLAEDHRFRLRPICFTSERVGLLSPRPAQSRQ